MTQGLRRFFEKLSEPKAMGGAFVVALAVAATFLLLRHHQPSPRPKPIDNGLPDYSGITVEHVIKTVQKPGRGKIIAKGDRVKLSYRMWIYDPSAIGNHGKSIAAEGERETDVVVGHGDIIQGWDQALIGMKKGEQSTIVIPPKLAYGEVAIPERVPAGAIIQIVNTVIEVEKPAPPDE